MIIAIDFDGTCVSHAFPEVGKEIGAPKVLKKLIENGHQLILWTMRSDIEGDSVPSPEFEGLFDGKYLTDAVNWFKKHNIPLYGIQNNPSQYEWTSSPKAYAHLYIDDAALGVPLIFDINERRPYVDWERVENLLKELKYIR